MRGVSLVELLVAAAIVSVGIVVISGVMSVTTEITSTDKQRRMARYSVIGKNAPDQWADFDLVVAGNYNDPITVNFEGDSVKANLSRTVTLETIKAQDGRDVQYAKVHSEVTIQGTPIAMDYFTTDLD